jgi:hypothetical protein
MRWLKTVVQILCLPPLITGALDLALGARVLSSTFALLSGRGLPKHPSRSQCRASQLGCRS